MAGQRSGEHVAATLLAREPVPADAPPDHGLVFRPRYGNRNPRKRDAGVPGRRSWDQHQAGSMRRHPPRY